MSGKPFDTVDYLFLGLLVLQFGLQPLLARHFVSKSVDGTSIVLAQETFKFLCGFLLLYLPDGGKSFQVERRKWNLKSSLVGAALPAMIYAIQNSLIWFAYGNLSGLMFNLINQTKVLFTAIFVYALLGKGQSTQQMAALCVLLVAAITLTATGEDSSDGKNSFMHGIVPLCIASALSGLASALCQYSLQGSIQRNSLVFSMELAAYCLVATICALVLSQVSAGTELRIFSLQGWDVYTPIPVIAQGLGGIIVGQVTKRAGGVVKGFAVCCGLILTAAVESFFGIGDFEFKHVTGLILVVSSLYAYTTSRPSSPVSKRGKSE